jgi:DNA-binding CsgD family transcriptional regulator
MVVARFRNEVPAERPAKPTAPPSEGSEKASFTIEGHHFVAIPQREWSASRRRNNASVGNGNGTQQPAGFVQLDGVRHVLVERDHVTGEAAAATPVSSMLTSRELQIAYSVADGKCDKVIAYDLGISEYTVREHMRRIFHKLKVSKRAALVAQLIITRVKRQPAP